jgi:N-acyl-L-homoserine lactone synthetase
MDARHQDGHADEKGRRVVKFRAKVVNVAPDASGADQIVATVDVITETMRVEGGVSVSRIEKIGTFTVKGKDEAAIRVKADKRLKEEVVKHRASNAAAALVGTVIAEVK